MGDRREDGQRDLKVTPKGRAPEITRVWEVEEKPWYVRYAIDWILLLMSVLLVILRTLVSDGSWVAFTIEVVLIFTFFMWLVTPPVEDHEM